MNRARVGVIAGGGDLPIRIAESLQKQGKFYVVAAINGEAQLTDFTGLHAFAYDIGQVGQIIALFKEHNIQEVVLAGKITRPAFGALNLDALGISLIGQITKAKLFGDDSVLSVVVKFLESQGFTVVGADSLTGEIITKAGCLTTLAPSKQTLEDIELGQNIARKIGELDIGQAVIIENGLVLGLEAVEGTDALIARAGKLKRESSGHGVLVKMKKPSQDARVDLPSIGQSTIQNLYEAGLAGVAIEAGHSIIIDQAKTIALADRLGLFILGV